MSAKFWEITAASLLFIIPSPLQSTCAWFHPVLFDPAHAAAYWPVQLLLAEARAAPVLLAYSPSSSTSSEPATPSRFASPGHTIAQPALTEASKVVLPVHPFEVVPETV